jgi:hypothetical protein
MVEDEYPARCADRSSPGKYLELSLLTEAKWVSGRIGMDDEDAPGFLDPTA